MWTPLLVTIKTRDGRGLTAEKIYNAAGDWSGERAACFTVDGPGQAPQQSETLYLFRCPACRLPVLDELGFACRCGSVDFVEWKA